MKRILLVVAMLTVLLMTGCNKDNTTQNNEVQDSQSNQQEQMEYNSLAHIKINTPFLSVLENIYDNHVLPDGTELYNLDSENQFAENKFAIFDIDFDSEDELIFSYNSGAMADIRDFIFDYDKDTQNIILEAEFNPSPITTYYDDGIVYEKGKHNQGNEDPWPYTLYQYNNTKDKYEIINKTEVTGNEIKVPFKEFTKENIDLLKNENTYVKLSDSYYFSDYKSIEMKEIIPISICLVDENSLTYVNSYGENVSIALPIEKCESVDEERIIYSDYGIEKMLSTGKIRIGGIEIDTIHPDLPIDENFSYKEEVAYYYNLGLQKVYEVELDNDTSTKELLVYSHFSYPWDSYEYPYLVELENGIATNMGLIENENIMQIGMYKNVLTDGWNSDIEGYFSNVLMGYYVYDKELGLIHVEKMANGDNIKDIDINMLTDCTLSRDIYFGAIGEYDLGYSDNVIYSTSAYGEEANIKTLSKGTIIKIVEIIDEYGNFIGETQDGMMYGFFSFAGRT